VVGLKPTYGSVSMRGVIPLSWSLDHAGPLTTSVADAGAVFDVIANEGREPAPGIMMPSELRVATDPRQLRAAVPRAYFFDDLDPEVSTAVDEALSILQNLVKEIREVTLPVNADRSLQAAEAYAYHTPWVFENPELYDPETLRRIRTGEEFTGEDRLRFARELAQERHEIRSVFEQVEVLITPTVPIPPPAIPALRQNSEALRPTELFLLRNTRPFNVWGLPAISIPCGFTKTGLPIGVQIAGPHWGEQAVIDLAYAYEQATEWHHRKPTML
jgi:Asp-tRNA(Asn)/Glu-tRNA(Gln) amidotransferase A subunit family amidase